MLWFLGILLGVVMGIGVIISIGLNLIEAERYRKQAGVYGIVVSLLLLITAMFTYRYLILH